MAIWNEPKSNYVASDEVTPDIFNELAENEKYLKETQDTKITSSEVKEATINNTQSSTRTNLTTTEKLKTGFGKIKKWFADLEALAFKDTVGNSDIIDVAASKEAIGLDEVANERQYSALFPPPYPVTKVQSRMGYVVITKDDIGLSDVENERIYPHILPQQPILPAIVYTPLSAQYDNALQKHTGFVRQRVQFSVHNTTFGKTRQVGRILKEVLQDFKGNMNGLNIQATHLINDLSSAGNTMTNYKIEEYVNILEFEFNYMEE